MKKTTEMKEYITPQCSLVEVEACTPMAAGSVTTITTSDGGEGTEELVEETFEW